MSNSSKEQSGNMREQRSKVTNREVTPTTQQVTPETNSANPTAGRINPHTKIKTLTKPHEPHNASDSPYDFVQAELFYTDIHGVQHYGSYKELMARGDITLDPNNVFNEMLRLLEEDYDDTELAPQVASSLSQISNPSTNLANNHYSNRISTSEANLSASSTTNPSKQMPTSALLHASKGKTIGDIAPTQQFNFIDNLTVDANTDRDSNVIAEQEANSVAKQELHTGTNFATNSDATTNTNAAVKTDVAVSTDSDACIYFGENEEAEGELELNAVEQEAPISLNLDVIKEGSPEFFYTEMQIASETLALIESVRHEIIAKEGSDSPRLAMLNYLQERHRHQENSDKLQFLSKVANNSKTFKELATKFCLTIPAGMKFAMPTAVTTVTATETEALTVTSASADLQVSNNQVATTNQLTTNIPTAITNQTTSDITETSDLTTSSSEPPKFDASKPTSLRTKAKQPLSPEQCDKLRNDITNSINQVQLDAVNLLKLLLRKASEQSLKELFAEYRDKYPKNKTKTNSSTTKQPQDTESGAKKP